MFKTMKFCIKCSKPAGHKCGRCGDYYCSAFCQDLHWSEHRYFCYPKPSLIPMEYEFGNHETDDEVEDNHFKSINNPFNGSTPQHVFFRPLPGEFNYEDDSSKDENLLTMPFQSCQGRNLIDNSNLIPKNIPTSKDAIKTKDKDMPQQFDNGNNDADRKISLIEFDPLESLNDDSKDKKTDAKTDISTKKTAIPDTKTAHSKDESVKMEEPSKIDDNQYSLAKPFEINTVDGFQSPAETKRDFKELPDNIALDPLDIKKPKYFLQDLPIIPLEIESEFRVEVLDFSQLDENLMSVVPVNPVSKILFVKLRKLVNQVAKKYTKLQNLPEVNELLLAKYNDVYLRAVCLKAESEDRIFIAFLDYGFFKTTKLSKLRTFPQELTFGYNTHLCYIPGLNSEEIDELYQNFNDGRRFLKIKVLQISPDYVTVKLLKKYE